VCDQGEITELKKLISTIGKVDIVIDDGSHMNEDVITSFKFLFKKISPGGYYVVEDTQTSYWNEYGGGLKKQSKKTTMQFFGSLIDCPNYRYFEDEDYSSTYFDKFIKEINFYENIIFIKKREKQITNDSSHFHQ